MGWQWSLIIIRGVTPADDTIARKVNTSDASCISLRGDLRLFPFAGYADHNFVFTCVAYTDRRAFLLKFSKVWGVIWLVIAFIFFLLGLMVGILAFKVRPHPKYAVLLLSFTLLIVACDLSCSNRRLSKRRMRSTSCPCQGLRAARSRCHCRPCLRCSSAHCRPHCSLCYD